MRIVITEDGGGASVGVWAGWYWLRRRGIVLVVVVVVVRGPVKETSNGEGGVWVVSGGNESGRWR